MREGKTREKTGDSWGTTASNRKGRGWIENGGRNGYRWYD
jgi:hypothetical protein